MGEAPSRDRGKQGPQYTEEMPTTSSESSLQVLVKKRPKALDSEGKGKDKRTKQGEVLPKDKRELEATSSGQSTESDEGGAVLACALQDGRHFNDASLAQARSVGRLQPLKFSSPDQCSICSYQSISLPVKGPRTNF